MILLSFRKGGERSEPLPEFPFPEFKHLLSPIFLTGLFPADFHIHSWDPENPGKGKGCPALAQKPAGQLQDTWAVRTT